MSLWNDVQDRVTKETQFSTRLKDEGSQSIEAFYPELYESPSRCEFTNTLGSDLIPDVLTSRKVLVDLYDWPDEKGLIRNYGVDLNFLSELRQAGLVRVCANLPPERYEQCMWLHGILADEGTIWRSIRTPGFFTSTDPEFAGRRTDREASLERYFATHSDALPALCALVDAAHPPKTAAELAAVLSHWIERLVSFEPELAAHLVTDFEKHAHERIPDLKQIHSLVVSPYSSALGGTMKMWRRHWSSLFGEENVAELSREGLLRSQALLSYLSEVKLSLTSSDLSAEQVWASMTEGTRLRLLDFLGDEAERTDLIAAEERIRRGLAVQGVQEPTREEIRAYLDDAQRTVGRLEAIWDGAQIALPIAFSLVSDNWLLAAEVSVGLFCSKRLLGDQSRRIVEALVGKVQIVRTLSRK